jgi:hypothetical protein
MEGDLDAEAEKQFVHVTGQPFAHDAELTPGGAEPAADTHARSIYRAIGIHQSLEEGEPLRDRTVQITPGYVLVPEYPQFAKLGRQRRRFAHRPFSDPAVTPLTLVMVLAQATRDDISSG